MAGRMLSFFGVLLAIMLVVSCVFATDDAAKKAEDAELLQRALERNAITECKDGKDRLIVEYQSHFNNRDFRKASDVLMRCALETSDPELSEKLKAARIHEGLQIINDRKSSASQRIEAIHAVIAYSPGLASKYEAQLKTLEAQAKKDEAIAKKQRGVPIGATAADVLASAWGRPERVNRTLTARGTTEQWVYGPGTYLYLQDGVLISIQTAND